MWKFLTRSIRDTIERRTCRTNVYSQSTQDGNSSSNNLEQKEYLSPSFSTVSHGYFGNGKYSGTKEKEDQSKYNPNFNWIDAVSWSSFLAIGYIVCQSICLQRKLFEIDNSKVERWRYKLLVYPQIQASRLINQFSIPEQNQSLIISDQSKEPNSETNNFNRTSRIKNLYESFAANILPVNNESTETSYSIEFSSENDSSIEHLLYGPITAQEAFEQAANEFSQTHQMVMGELELDYGSRALEEKRYDDAIEHFIMGTKLSSASSMFNLGLCYELGIGTNIDYAKAVKYYKRAAHNGHIDAMYNLGVFYAQGKGGLKRNKDIARQLFKDAAKKGQGQALKALQLEESFKKRSEMKQHQKYNFKVETMNNKFKDSVLSKFNTYSSMLITNLNNKTERDEFINSFDECMDQKNSTDIFLDIIGVHQ